jgi:hypothetical protein
MQKAAPGLAGLRWLLDFAGERDTGASSYG